ncbi:histone H4 transcription factor [Megalops cyprinoides]|uniref:histone H4 transcription factor n=1 Tax=Megalops cyprinoides TaxID=118141 RepID=UPI0018650710|nr:histone H4 transcription factor [Megalops cyprinoides]XP_036392537.1 histone H4 transcription factor [Megalops cyprinoides]XP_036392538.1 histone H4 transcription factor [Megalops cyprinoides]XP_036392539.1 histone H4 transcription factor [Megalops cyprinoides]
MAKKRNLADLVVACEWASCTFKGRTMEELCEHMSLHLKDHLGDGDAMEELDDYACLWEGCEFLAMGSPSELVVHALFHIFHSKLKFIGAQLLQAHPELPSCTQDLHSNNLVPELAEGFVCQWEHCDSTFNNAEWFYRHVDMHAHCTKMQPLPDQQQALFCSWKGCDAFFKIKYRLREHLRSHTQERLVACPTCGCMFSSNTKFFDHIHRQAEPEESFVCEHCDKRFANERLLRDHVRQHVNHIKCPLCDMTCTSLASLKTHIKFRHCDERPFPCDFCESSFKNQHDLRKHMETHNEGTAFHCSVEGCQYSSRMAHTMNQHYKRVHEGDMVSKYKCHLCDKTFSWCYTLTLHLRKKHYLKWPSGHSRFRYKEDEDGYLRLNMVRYETVEVTEEIMKNMAKKRTPRKASGSGGQAKRPALPVGGAHSISPCSSSPSSSSSSSSCSGPSSSELAGQPSSVSPDPKDGGQAVYCAMSTVTELCGDPGLSQDSSHAGGPSGAVKALTEVARGLGMDVV